MVIYYRRFGTTPFTWVKNAGSNGIVRGFLILKAGTDGLSLHVGKELSLYAVLYPRTAQFSSASRRKPEVTRMGSLLQASVAQTLCDRGPVNSFFIRRGPGPNRFTRKYLSIFFKVIH